VPTPNENLAPRLANIRLHPIKALDPVAVREARIGPNGGLELDRAWALYSADGRWVNGKRTAAMHLIRSVYSPELTSVTLTVPGDRRDIPPMTFAFPGDTEGAAEWFSMYFEQAIVVHYAREGFPDDGLAPGPTIVSTPSLRAVCEWFPGLTLDEARRRFRSTLEIDAGPTVAAVFRPRDLDANAAMPGPRHYGAQRLTDKTPERTSGQTPHLPAQAGSEEGGYSNGETTQDLPAFWEDQLFAASDTNVVRFKIGEIAFEGSNPCARCPVPSRDSRTGEVLTGFQTRFAELRRNHLPPWAPADRFDHYYRLATNTRVPSTEHGKLLRVGDVLSL